MLGVPAFCCCVFSRAGIDSFFLELFNRLFFVFVAPFSSLVRPWPFKLLPAWQCMRSGGVPESSGSLMEDSSVLMAEFQSNLSNRSSMNICDLY